MQNKVQLKLRVTIARSTVLMFAIITVLNVFLTMRASDWTLPFSSVISGYSVALCKGLVDLEGAPAYYLYLAVAISALIAAALVFCYFRSKNDAKWLKYVLYFVIVDFTAAVFVMVSDGASATFAIEAIMHALMAYYLIKGIKSAEMLDTYTETGADYEEDNEEYDEDGYEDEEEDEYKEEHKEYDYDCDKIFEAFAEHNGHEIAAALYGGELVLAIDGFIYDSAEFEAKYDYELSAGYDEHGYSIYYYDEEQLVSFYADGELIGSKSIR